ncbi:MAG: hypothetical protein PHC64_06105 [Candidatus Gastranaerophilales bacterium]|nr:hypothetical protein [Candidatus Gastranaerophilales bacterium]
MFELLWKSCAHDKITPNITAGYCPDCGEYVKNHWYITRCKCCGIKQKSLVKNGKILSETRFCKNCGSNLFRVEELETLDIVNINYAVVQKQATKIKQKSFVQTWIENSYSPIKLLPSY